MRAALAALLLSACAHAPSGLTRDELVLSLPTRSVTTELRAATLQRKVLLVNYLTSWCFPCLTDLAVLTRLQKDHEADGLVVVIVGLDLEGARVLAPFAQESGLTMPVLVADDRIRNGESPLGRLRELPVKVLFDRDGRLVTGYSGVADPAALVALVKATLDKR